jgi:2-succinyl-5-enolpyruvyl-6-hydroxy-3-cyclohexene-1-carboxylate synthase
MALARDPHGGAPAARQRDGGEDIYTHHVATPTGLDFAAAGALYGIAHERVGDVHGFRAALERALDASESSIIEARGERPANVALHRSVWDAVSRALNP